MPRNLPSLLSSNIFSVQGRIVLITGGGSGMGKDMALALAVNGAKVYVVGRRKEMLEEVAALVKDQTGSVIPIQGDVASLEGINKVFEEFKKHETVLDVLVNNVGTYRPVANVDPTDATKVAESLLSAKWEDFTAQTEINVAPTYFLSATFIPLLQQSRSAAIINNASALALCSGVTTSPSYNSSKAAVLSLTKTLAGRLIPLNIRVNAISTFLHPSEITGSPEAIAANPASKAILRDIPAHRPSFPENLGGIILFLASKASEYSNGLNMTLDGGWLLTESAEKALPKLDIINIDRVNTPFGWSLSSSYSH
ncbi:hypothetical protein BDY24DRAFT_417039 [Mrakia frigida]|uniref:SDR family NAD(P)-dependent oxidoreductase n=1 Tax=Mrakia frigida TaxID=29902 RepID=UPI003FCC1AAF